MDGGLIDAGRIGYGILTPSEAKFKGVMERGGILTPSR